ncbi:tRNA guanosine(34) transglycosylase Tgt [Candidatus Gracilibacteria bacterium]|nr:tRNA guanosine(34) transglycosylase Tgt [Candidatus Gracilibacteria bacterium]
MRQPTPEQNPLNLPSSGGQFENFSFTLSATDGYARAGTIVTPHGVIETPIFMPVGTRSAVKGATIDQVKEIGSEIMLVNNYHSYLRPGCDVIEALGGLHSFMDVDIPILTDSGGFQVFSLGLGMSQKSPPLISEAGKGTTSTSLLRHNSSSKSGELETYKREKSNESLAKITEEGVNFRSYLDGSKHFFSAENVMNMQSALGADIIMAFDECAPGGSTHEYARQAMERTHRWAVRSQEQWLKNEKIRAEKGLYPQTLFAIIQGVVYDDLRVESCEFISSLDTPGIAIGGLSVGESKEDMYRILDVLAPILPVNKPHYLMGVGTPEDLVEGIARGIDMMDCVLPTRIGRHGEAFSSYGNLKIGGEKYKFSSEKIPMLPGYETQISKRYSLGYLRHLINVGEATGGVLLSLHNLEYLLLIAKKSRQAILAGKFEEFRAEFWSVYPKK